MADGVVSHGEGEVKGERWGARMISKRTWRSCDRQTPERPKAQHAAFRAGLAWRGPPWAAGYDSERKQLRFVRRVRATCITRRSAS